MIRPGPNALPAYPRYAIYFVPDRHSALYGFGAGLLGYDAYDGRQLSFPTVIVEAYREWSAVTATPRRYGFHATLKAPFALASGMTEAGLRAACDVFATTPRDKPAIHLAVDGLGAFIALVAVERSESLNHIAAACVRDFDAFRAPLTAEDHARRHRSVLTPSQAAHLDRWGYPHVMEDFRFHMTLTGRVPVAHLSGLLVLLQTAFLAAVGKGPVAVDRITLLRQNAGEPFRVMSEHRLV